MALAIQTSNAAINATIKAVRTTRIKLDETIQKGIEQCIEHGNAFGDVTGAARLLDAIGNTGRRGEVIAHFTEYSPIRISKDNKTGLMKASLRKEGDKDYNPFNLDGVKANPWYKRESLHREQGVSTFNFAAAEGNLIKMADLFKTKSVATNRIETGADGKQVEKIYVENNDRKKLSAMADMLRRIAEDPESACKKLGIDTSAFTAADKEEAALISDPAAADVGAQARTGTDG